MISRKDNFDFDDLNNMFMERYLVIHRGSHTFHFNESTDPICLRMSGSDCPELIEFHIDNNLAEDEFYSQYHNTTLRDIMLFLWHSANGVTRTLSREIAQDLGLEFDIVDKSIDKIMSKYIQMSAKEAQELWEKQS